MNRPAVKNAMNFAMCQEMAAIFSALRTDSSTRVLVIKGAGTDFSSGGDLKDIAGLLLPDRKERGAAAAKSAREVTSPLFLALQALPQPVIASVRGHAVGAGIQIVLAADLVIASDTAKLILPQVKLGHNIDHGESWYLPRKIGLTRSLELLLMGDAFGAKDAERYGLVNWVVSDDALESRTAEIAARLASSATVAIAQIKQLLRQSWDNTLEQQLAAEAQALSVSAATNDFVEAIGAFTAKRKPVFQGR